MCCCECDEWWHWLCCSPWFTWFLEWIVYNSRDCFEPVKRGLGYCCEQLCCCGGGACCCPEEGAGNPCLCLGRGCEECLRGTTDSIRGVFLCLEGCSKIPSILFWLAVLALMMWGAWELVWLPDKQSYLKDARAGVVALRGAIAPG